MKRHLIPVLGFLASPLFAAGTVNTFDITINYSGNPTYLPMFQSAEAIWEQIIPSYIDGDQGVTPLTGITITAAIEAIDGAGGILGSAGPTSAVTDNSGYVLATTGDMQFDEADVGGLGANLVTVILHEMGHVLGIGTLWTNNSLYVNGSAQYTGANGLAAYKSEFNQPSATFVPVEQGGGPGTADGHWNEVDNGAALTGLVSSEFGGDMRYELMTGWLNSDQPYFISNLTRGSLRDLGYDAVLVPEVSSSLLAGLAVVSLSFRRRRW
jgi:hypothetical protein